MNHAEEAAPLAAQERSERLHAQRAREKAAAAAARVSRTTAASPRRSQPAASSPSARCAASNSQGAAGGSLSGSGAAWGPASARANGVPKPPPAQSRSRPGTGEAPCPGAESPKQMRCPAVKTVSAVSSSGTSRAASRVKLCSRWSRSRQAGTKTAPVTPSMFMAHEPQMPSRQSCSNAIGSLPSTVIQSLTTSSISRNDISSEMSGTSYVSNAPGAVDPG